MNAYQREWRALAVLDAGRDPDWLVSTDAIVRRIELLLRGGETYRSLGARLGVPPSTLCRTVTAYRASRETRMRRSTAERILERHRLDAWKASRTDATPD